MTQAVMSGAVIGAMYVTLTLVHAGWSLLLTPFIQVKPDGGYSTVYPKDFAGAPLAPCQAQP